MDVVEQIEAILDRATQDFDGRDEIMRRAADEITKLRVAALSRTGAVKVRETLEAIKDAILRADPNVLTDTFWMPDDVFKGGTVVDFIDHALSAREPAAPDNTATMLSNLLARIHRDGGHYEAMNGTEKAAADADDIIARIYASQPAAPEGEQEAVADCHDENHSHSLHDWRMACVKCGAFRGSDLSTHPAEQAVTDIDAILSVYEGTAFADLREGEKDALRMKMRSAINQVRRL